MRRRLWIGTYPVAGQGTDTGLGEGVWSVDLDLNTGSLADPQLAAIAPAPSYLVESGGRYYAVNEQAAGGLTVLQPATGGLAILATATTRGAHPCHLLISTRLRAAVVANYSSGTVSVHLLDDAGLPGPEPDQVIGFAGSGPAPGRQDAPHAHHVLPSPDRRYLLVCDLGTDRIHRLRMHPVTRRLSYDGVAAVLPAGSGPRHAVVTGGHLHVVGELDGRLHTLVWDGPSGRATPLAATRLSEIGGYPAHLSRTGRLLAATSRGDDRLSWFALNDHNLPQPEVTIPLPGSWPRHHATIGDWTVVALQHSGQVVSLDRQGRRRGEAAIPSPACVCPEPESTLPQRAVRRAAVEPQRLGDRTDAAGRVPGQQ